MCVLFTCREISLNFTIIVLKCLHFLWGDKGKILTVSDSSNSVFACKNERFLEKILGKKGADSKAISMNEVFNYMFECI